MCRAVHRSWVVEQHEDTPARASVDDALRVSDDDRRRVIEQLRTYTADGRLSLDEFAGRVGETWGSATYGELRSVLRDLPVATPIAVPPVPQSRPRQRGLPLPLLVALLVVVGSVLMSHFAWWLIPVGFWFFGGCGRQRAARNVSRRVDPISV